MAGSVVVLFQADEAKPSAKTPSPGEPAQDWKTLFAKERVDPKRVRDLVADFHAAGKLEDVIALIEQAIIHGQIQPWMYEVLALTMTTAGRPPVSGRAGRP